MDEQTEYTVEERELIKSYCEQTGLDPTKISGYQGDRQ